MTRTSKHGLWTHRFRIIRVLDGAEQMIGLDDELMLANDLHLAKLAFERAKDLYPHAVGLKLMHGSRVMDEWPAPAPSGRVERGGLKGLAACHYLRMPSTSERNDSMAIHWLSFRIAEKMGSGLLGKTYSARLQALNEAVEKHARLSWEDTTSFYVFSSGSSRSSIVRDVKAAIDPRIDLVLVGGVDSVGATIIGTSPDEDTLEALIPDLVKA